VSLFLAKPKGSPFGFLLFAAGVWAFLGVAWRNLKKRYVKNINLMQVKEERGPDCEHCREETHLTE